jgi:N-acyl-D-amino-acid deacylase
MPLSSFCRDSGGVRIFLWSLCTISVLGLSGAVFAEDFDVLLENATIADGTGKPLFPGSIGIRDGRIASVGNAAGSARVRIDVKGQVAAPGFIDVHTHSEDICEIPVAENFLRMGVTTIITGNCGSSNTNVGEFFSHVEKTKTAVNVATLIGHNSVRRRGMGGNFKRPPTETELTHMKTQVDRAMRDGAVGLSTGLIYVPGTFSGTDEIVELAKVAASYGGIYVSHMRSENTKIFEAIEEFLRIAREAKIRSQVSHIKLSAPTSWGKAGEVLGILNRARAEGLAITHDNYAYTASSTGIAQLIPDSMREGTREDFAARVADPMKKEQIFKLMADAREKAGRTDYQYAVIAQFKGDPRLNGKSIPEAARLLRGGDSIADQVETILDLEMRGGASAVYHNMNAEDQRTFLAHPLTMVASDGSPRVLGEAVPHPRSYGNNARVLGQFVREEKVMSVPEAVRRMSSLPAVTFDIKDRGELRVGAWADVVVFDPDKVRDPSTMDDPHHYAEGFSTVIVNGVPVILEGALTSERTGMAVRKGR